THQTVDQLACTVFMYGEGQVLTPLRMLAIKPSRYQNTFSDTVRLCVSAQLDDRHREFGRDRHDFCVPPKFGNGVLKLSRQLVGDGGRGGGMAEQACDELLEESRGPTALGA